jgi:uncharacterized protein (DUF1330 family)
MNRTFTLGLVLLAGIAIGGTAVSSLSAQSKGPGAYAIIDIAQIIDRDSFVKDLLRKAAPAILSGGGKFVTRTEKISALEGTPPQRFVIIAFDNTDKAKAWNASPAWREVDAMRTKFTKSRTFVVDAEGATP